LGGFGFAGFAGALGGGEAESAAFGCAEGSGGDQNWPGGCDGGAGASITTAGAGSETLAGGGAVAAV